MYVCLQGALLPLLYKLLTANDTEACIAAVNMLHVLVCTEEQNLLAKQQLAISLYGNGAILLYMATKVQQMCAAHQHSQADQQELSLMLSLLGLIAQGVCVEPCFCLLIATVATSMHSLLPICRLVSRL